MSKLAIVIPAYKEKYFSQSLKSLAEQTNKNFNIYVGDDNSPFDLKKIVDDFKYSLNIEYIKFSNNIGAKNLVNQWKRCVDLVKDEEWIWLFSDDDIAEKTCVEKFYTMIDKNNKIDVYRFNTVIIDGDDKVIMHTNESPSYETSEAMAYHLLKGSRGNSMPDHVFKKSIYEAVGGFVYTDYAQGADWASSILFSKNNGISIIPGAKILWRLSDTNISGRAHIDKDAMFVGYLQFIEWVLNHFQYLKECKSEIRYEMMQNAVIASLKWVIQYHYKGIPIKRLRQLYLLLRNKMQLSVIGSTRAMYSFFK